MGSRLHPIEFAPAGRRTMSPEGTTLLEAARQAGVPIASVCGGKGTCGKCRVRASGDLSPLSAEETACLSAADIQAGYRLACQARVQGPATVQARPADVVAYKAALRPLGPRVDLQPGVNKVYLRLPHPSLADQRADLDRLCRPLQIPCQSVELSALRNLPAVLRAADWSVTVVLAGGRLIGVEEGDTRERNYGLAIDLGTTTVAAYIISPRTGQQLGAALATNRQTAYGDDVISRLDYAHAGGLAELRQAALETLNLLVEELCRQVGIVPQNIYEAVVVGNTCMVELLLGIDPYPIGVAPYVPATVDPLDLAGDEVRLDMAAGGRVHILPAVAGYVGADAVADALASALGQDGQVRLLMDLGTNAEMILSAPGRLLACAAAAGPAFEGARISCGMRAAPGAIDQVAIANGRVAAHTLEGWPPVGLAGSGLVSVAAAMRRSGLLNTRGHFVPEAAPAGLFAHGEAGLEFCIVPSEESGTGEIIGLSQRDISELLLAKAAINAGMKVLLKEAGLSVGDIAEVLISGSFGNYINKEEAIAIGLVPQLPLERVVGIGNAAGTGAIQALLSLKMRRQALEIARRIEYIELSAHPEFSTEFVRGMSFPEIGQVTENETQRHTDF